MVVLPILFLSCLYCLAMFAILTAYAESIFLINTDWLFYLCCLAMLTFLAGYSTWHCWLAILASNYRYAVWFS
jgi:hypothetical protein